jgi:hypothetical protein
MRKLLFALRAISYAFKIKDFNSKALDHGHPLGDNPVLCTSMENKRSTRLSRAKNLVDHDQLYPCFIV